MFFQRRRLQVLFSFLLIICCGLFLFGQLQEGWVTPRARADSQLSESLFLLRHNYVRPIDEAPLLESAVRALRAEALARGIAESRLPSWRPLAKPPGEEGLAKVEAYLAELSGLEPEKFPLQEAVYVAISGMLEGLADPYTFVMTPGAYAKFVQSLHTHVYGGVGLEIEWTKGAYVVFAVAPNSPASLAKIRPGDKILEVDGIELAPKGRQALSLHHARALLSGKVGSEIKMRLARQHGVFHRTLTLTKFESRSVLGRMVGDPELRQPRIGWIFVRSLGQESGQELLETVAQLADKGAEGFVIDLRDNVGGYLNAAVEISSSFLPSGVPVVTIAGRSGDKPKHTIGTEPLDDPLLVLINSRTASSAEILAAALREHGRAYLLGDKTFGKGSVQTMYDFVDGGGFKMTTATYLTPSGQVLEGRGLTPDRAVDVSAGRDEALIQQDVLELSQELWKEK